MVFSPQARFSYSEHPLNTSFGLPFDYNGTLDILITPGQKGILIFWFQKSLLVSRNSGEPGRGSALPWVSRSGRGKHRWFFSPLPQADWDQPVLTRGPVLAVSISPPAPHPAPVSCPLESLGPRGQVPKVAHQSPRAEPKPSLQEPQALFWRQGQWLQDMARGCPPGLPLARENPGNSTAPPAGLAGLAEESKNPSNACQPAGDKKQKGAGAGRGTVRDPWAQVWLQDHALCRTSQAP